jgi:porin
MQVHALTFALAAICEVEGSPACAPLERTPAHSHTRDPQEVDERPGPVLLQLTYTSEVTGNAAGGIKRGARYLDNLDIEFEADLDRMVGWTGGQLHLYGLYNNGASIGELIGDAQATSNIETGNRAIRLYEAWIDQKIGANVSLRAGLYDLNSEFDTLEAAGLFTSSAHGIGTDFSQSGRNGPSIFPSTSLAARVQVAPATGWVVRAAVLDGVPGDPDRPRRTAILLGQRDGALLVGEVEAPVADGRLLFGHWRYTAKFDTIEGGAGTGNSGSYLRVELPLADRQERRIDGFARVGSASGRFNMFSSFASMGLKFTGWFPDRMADEFGIAVAAAFTSRPYRVLAGAAPAEVAFEATYRAQLAPWLLVQPNVHYIRRPSANRRIDDALVIGIRTGISFDLLGD